MKKYLITLITSLLIFCINLPSYAISYAYDSLNRLTHTEYQTGQYIAYNYDPAGNLLDTKIGMTSYHIIVGTSDNKIYIYSPQGELQHEIDSPVAQPLVTTLDADNDKSDEIAVQTSTTLYELDATISNATLPNDAFIIKADVINDEAKETITSSQTTNQITIDDQTILAFNNTDTTRSRNIRNGNKSHKVDVCHKGKTINIDKSSLQDHLSHGDTEGACGSTPSSSNNSDIDIENASNSSGLPHKVDVCHDGKTLNIAKAALEAHLNHGDSLGACDTSNTGDSTTGSNGSDNNDTVDSNDNGTTTDDNVQNFGVNIALTDTNLNGKTDIVAAMASQGSKVEMLTGNGIRLNGFTAYDSNVGVIIAAGQLLDDALPEIITSSIGSSEVNIFNTQGNQQNSFTVEGTIISLAIGKQLIEDTTIAPPPTKPTGSNLATITENETTITGEPNVPVCSTDRISGDCKGNGAELADNITIPESTSVSNVVLNDTVIDGWASDLMINDGAIVDITESGVLTGTIINNGTLKNVNFRGYLLKGGILSGLIYVEYNGSKGLGLGNIEDVELAEDATLIGGVLWGTIKGNPKKPALIVKAWIRKGAKLSHVRLGRDVKLDNGVEKGEGVEYENITLENLEAD